MNKNGTTKVSKVAGIVLILGLLSLLPGSALVSDISANASDVLLVSVAITASPGTICPGQSAFLTWSSTDATSVVIDQGIGSVLPFGDRSVSPTQTTTYTITGTNSSGGYGTASATVHVSAACPTPTWSPSPTPTPWLTISPATVTVDSDERVTFTARGGDSAYYWDTDEGSPSTGWGSSFTTRFHNYGYYTEYHSVVVMSAGLSAQAWVSVRPEDDNDDDDDDDLSCTRSASIVDSGEDVWFYAHDGRGSSYYYWYASNGEPSYGYGSSFTTRFYNSSHSTRSYTVTVEDGYDSASCTVSVRGDDDDDDDDDPDVGFVHSVRNLTRSGEGSSVTAYNGDRLQFTVRITTGSRTAQDVHVRNWLPSYVTYVWGSTTVNGTQYQDGIATGGSNDSLALGNLSRNRTYTVRFEAVVQDAPTLTLTNTVNLHVRGTYDRSRSSTVSVVGPYWTPVPAPSPNTQSLGLTLAVRNVTRGQTGEYRSVSARGGDRVDFILRVQAPSASSVTNVVLTDYLPTGLAYDSGTTTRDGIAADDGITAGGFSLGTLYAGQTVIVKFSARVDDDAVPSWGTVTVTDSAQVRADGRGTAGDSVRLTLGTDESLTAVSAIKTGPADTALLALLIAAMVTGLYAAYTRTGLFGRRMTAAELAALVRRPLNFSR